MQNHGSGYRISAGQGFGKSWPILLETLANRLAKTLATESPFAIQAVSDHHVEEI